MLEKNIITGFADEIAPDLDVQIRVLKKLGMNHIEMRGVDGKGLVTYSPEEVKTIKDRLDAAGMRLSALGSPIGKIGVLEDFAPHFELFRHTVEIAHIMETPYIRMFSFFIPQGENPSLYRDEVMKRIGAMVDYATEHQVILLHENEKEIYGDVASRCVEIMKEFYGDHMKAVFDFANFVQCGQDTQEAYELLKPYIAYIHIKDALKRDGSVVPAGMGDGHVAEILKELDQSGYAGYLSLEPHLSEFTGYAALGDGTSIHGRKLTGEEAFTTSYRALSDLLASSALFPWAK
ncbi:MAG: sugar phosphate isomerase/epimerase family protein [Hungatella sp.]